MEQPNAKKSCFPNIMLRRRIISALNAATYDTYGKKEDIVSFVMESWLWSLEKGLAKTDENFIRHVEAYVMFTTAPTRQEYRHLTLEAAGISPDTLLEDAPLFPGRVSHQGMTLLQFLEEQTVSGSFSYTNNKEQLYLFAVNKALCENAVKPIPYPTRPHSLSIEGITALSYMEECRRRYPADSFIPREWIRNEAGLINPFVLAVVKNGKESTLIVPEALIGEVTDDLYFKLRGRKDKR